MKTLTAVLFIMLFPLLTAAQERPAAKSASAVRDSIVVPDFVTLSGVDIQKRIFEYGNRRKQIQAQIAALLNEDNQLVGAIYSLQNLPLHVDSTLTRRLAK